MNKRDSLALITGASSGIGAAFGRYRLLLVARRKDRLDKLAAQLGNAEVLAADLTSDADIRRVEERISEETRLELLINNAGFGTLGAFFEADLQSQIRMHQLHVIAIARLTHTALKGMVSRDNGAIINVSSVAAFFHLPLSVSYGATKAWINSFTESIFLELKCMRSPVRVQALCPGFTITEFHDVQGVDRSFVPRSFWMSADDVVDASMLGLQRNRLFVIPGWHYRLLAKSHSLLPQVLQHAIAIRYGGRRRQSPIDGS
jgi:short-subunit dehydrogenase